MADVEQRAEAEAQHKGLSGGAARAYVGGVFNRIRQAHSRGTQPGKGARHLQRRARVEARQEARNRVSRHEQLAALEKQRLRSRTHREEPRKVSAQPAPTPAQPAATGKASAKGGKIVKPAKQSHEHAELVPIKDMTGRFRDPSAPVDPYFLQELYGDAQLERALDRYTTARVREAVRAVQAKHPGTKPAGHDKAAMIRYIKQHI